MMVEVPLDPSGNLGEKVGWFGGRSFSILAGTSIYVIYSIYFIYTIYQFILSYYILYAIHVCVLFGCSCKYIWMVLLDEQMSQG